MKSYLMLAAAVGLLIGADKKASPDDAVKAEMKKLEGTWLVVSRQVGQIRVPDKEVKKDGLTFTFRDGKYVMKMGKLQEPGTFTVDPTTTPKKMDLNQPRKGKPAVTVPGIYKLEGDTLTVCYHGKKRPTEFKADARSENVIYTLKRVKNGD
jgi:uncharacterized protein (TIGR03067 family)